MSESAEPGMRVLHVTEAMTTGVLSFVDSISRAQAAAGAQVEVLYAVRRAETAPRDQLEARFDERVRLREAIDHGSTKGNALAMAREVRRLARAGAYDVIHFHSSIAGGVGRLAVTGVCQQTAYSPHGFAFLREDQGGLVRTATRWAERFLAKRSQLILTSGTEIEIARRDLHAPRVAYLQSGVSRASVEASDPSRPAEGRPRVTMLGRIAYQKAPWRFAAVATALSALAEFVWVGGGDDADRERWIGDAPVTVLDWVSPDRLEDLLRDTHVLLFPSLWEGMSLSLIQAQGRGIPAVTTDVVGNRDTVKDGVTGFVCSTDEELVDATRRLVEDPELRARMAAAARAHVLENFTDDGIGVDSLALYRDARSR